MAKKKNHVDYFTQHMLWRLFFIPVFLVFAFLLSFTEISVLFLWLIFIIIFVLLEMYIYFYIVKPFYLEFHKRK